MQSCVDTFFTFFSHGTAAIIMKKADLQLSFLLTFLVNVKCNTNLAIALFNFDVFTNYI